MARLKNGLLGGITGAIGNIEGYMLRGQLVYRTRRAKSTKPPSEKQLSCRLKMKITKRFLGAFAEFVKAGFAYISIGKTYSATEAAVGWQIKNAIVGEYPNLTIDYAAVKVTAGPIDTKDIHAAATLEDNKLIFTWTPDNSFKHASDRVMLLAYSPVLNEAVYILCGERRSTGTDQLILPVDQWGRDVVVETYLSFITENGIRCTDSIYTGNFSVG
ncbi:hypothetical protein SAMN05518672_101770 [Chitinophaga sp. CF118]|uniref:DUF6266 family protein n=1 Tax=Chitinophaga sp. CF118 TaxID=1884367 RepID=UPI0008EC0969|nr:DUF6266 family protein [Chitinophaga sp. CF118]SFD15379.1 hypothetical protein SAMN05518672_101770 [Chitinophaga sp. CF118]